MYNSSKSKKKLFTFEAILVSQSRVYPLIGRKMEGLFSGPATKALPPPLELSGHKKIRISFLFKKVFFLSAQALNGRVIKEYLLLGFPKGIDLWAEDGFTSMQNRGILLS